MIITPADLATNIYAEIINEITRNDDTITTRAINAAIQEAKMYLPAYDLLQLFGNEDATPVVSDEYLKRLVKDIACWHLVRLSAAGIDDAACRTAYEDALQALGNIRDGKMHPPDWPYRDTTADAAPEGDSVTWSSNPKRNNHY